ncbi:MAG: hypothetical protein Kow0069_08140 [Promethearchaeota archaeon]
MADASVVFVCFGNTCRSPAAEGYAKKWLADRGLSDRVHVESAGLNSFFSTAQPNTVKILARDGVDLSGHRCQRLTPQSARKFTWVVTMERWQRDEVRSWFSNPERRARVVTLKELAARGPDPEGDVADPYGRPLEFYEEVLAEIKRHVDWAMEEIARAAGIGVVGQGQEK